MLFNSLGYAVFLPIVFIVYWLIPHKYRWIFLLGASYYFYMSWNPELVVLISGVTLETYFAARLIANPTRSNRARKWILAVGVIIPLLVLFFFKYFNFFSEAVTQALPESGGNPVLVFQHQQRRGYLGASSASTTSRKASTSSSL